MEELAVVALSEGQVPADLESLKKILIKNGLEGKYSIGGEFLLMENEEGKFMFNLYEAVSDEFGDSDPGIDIAGNFDDVAATLIDLEEIFEDAFPGSEFSSVYD